MKKTWVILSEILNRKAINPLPDMMTIQGCDRSSVCQRPGCINVIVTIKKLLLNRLIYFLPQWECRMCIEIVEHDRYSFRYYLTPQTETNFSFHMIDINATVRIIKSMKMPQSKGHDGISLELIKLINTDISSIFTIIINQSLTSGIFPEKLKIVKKSPPYSRKVTKSSFATIFYLCMVPVTVILVIVLIIVYNWLFLFL